MNTQKWIGTKHAPNDSDFGDGSSFGGGNDNGAGLGGCMCYDDNGAGLGGGMCYGDGYGFGSGDGSSDCSGYGSANGNGYGSGEPNYISPGPRCPPAPDVHHTFQEHQHHSSLQRRPKMVKTLISIVTIAIVALLGADAYLVYAGKASSLTVIELCTGGIAAIAIAVVAIREYVNKWKRNRAEQKESEERMNDEISNKVDEIFSKVDEIKSTTEECRELVQGAADSVESISSRLNDEYQVPDAYIPVILERRQDGKFYEAYRLPEEESRSLAVDSARASIEAKTAEGCNPDDLLYRVEPAFSY